MRVLQSGFTSVTRKSPKSHFFLAYVIKLMNGFPNNGKLEGLYSCKWKNGTIVTQINAKSELCHFYRPALWRSFVIEK
jgi:hypothetical protein